MSSSASTAELDMIPRLVTEGGAVVYDYSPRQKSGFVFSEEHLRQASGKPPRQPAPGYREDANGNGYRVDSDPHWSKPSNDAYRTGFDRAFTPDKTVFTVSNPGRESSWMYDNFMEGAVRRAAEDLAQKVQETIDKDLWRHGKPNNR